MENKLSRSVGRIEFSSVEQLADATRKLKRNSIQRQAAEGNWRLTLPTSRADNLLKMTS